MAGGLDAVDHGVAKADLISVFQQDIRADHPVTEIWILRDNGKLRLALHAFPFIPANIGLCTVDLCQGVRGTKVVVMKVRVQHDPDILWVKACLPDGVYQQMIQFGVACVDHDQPLTGVDQMRTDRLVANVIDIPCDLEWSDIKVIGIPLLQFSTAFQPCHTHIIVFIPGARIVIVHVFPLPARLLRCASFYFPAHLG